ncbi:helix-turn-helix transcriptional regulator [Rivibacter subsaxonicus]|uniref:AlpA family transcriptional regulator n=1 Tax=Rivibacter subsaxonicus TaxID=457575 RepID=A0A4Q7VWC0_9BURK|nr:AlpA family transcriptional regulator [Rivibacter subsaxonicus]RZU00893.1 AlpA family transcriptional regulator [Rivibacter subsaxonicus]
MNHVFLRLPVVKARTGLSGPTIRRWITEGRFPAPVPLGGRSVGWLSTEVDAWMDAQLNRRAAQSPGTAAARAVGDE